ncbi:unnamed protein product [Pylaiella littoralis]
MTGASGAAEIFGDLTVKVVRGVDLQNIAVFGTCNPYVLVKMRSSIDSMTTCVRENDANPSWQDTFTFRNVSSTDELQISLMEKDGAREGVVSVAGFLPSTQWGFPGFGGGDRVLEVAMPFATRNTGAPNMGTIVLNLQYRAELNFRAPFGLLKTAAAKTAVVTDKAKMDVVLDKAINVVFKPVSIAGRAAKRMTKAQKIACGGSAAVVSTAVGGGVSMALMAFAVPVVLMALLFLPLTLMGGVLFAVAMLALLPLALTLGWLVLCSRPVQCRVWMPSLFWVLCKFPLAHKALLEPRRPISGSEQ